MIVSARGRGAGACAGQQAVRWPPAVSPRPPRGHVSVLVTRYSGRWRLVAMRLQFARHDRAQLHTSRKLVPPQLIEALAVVALVAAADRLCGPEGLQADLAPAVQAGLEIGRAECNGAREDFLLFGEGGQIGERTLVAEKRMHEANPLADPLAHLQQLKVRIGAPLSHPLVVSGLPLVIVLFLGESRVPLAPGERNPGAADDAGQADHRTGGGSEPFPCHRASVVLPMPSMQGRQHEPESVPRPVMSRAESADLERPVRCHDGGMPEEEQVPDIPRGVLRAKAANPGTFRAAARRWLRKLSTALLPWTVVGCAVALTLTAGGSAARLNYVKALIWPVVAVVVVWSLRDLLRAKVGQVEEVDALGVAMKFRVDQQADRQLDSGVRIAVADLEAAEASIEVRATEEADDGTEVGAVLEAARAEAERKRRSAIERLINESAQWGFVQGGGLGYVLEPILRWNADGTPTLVTDSSGRGTREWLEKVQRRSEELEDEVIAAEDEFGERSPQARVARRKLAHFRARYEPIFAE